MFQEYKVEWTIEIDADSPQDAAKRALAIQRMKGSGAVTFKVWNEAGEETCVNLDDEEEPDEEKFDRIMASVAQQAYHDEYCDDPGHHCEACPE